MDRITSVSSTRYERRSNTSTDSTYYFRKIFSLLRWLRIFPIAFTELHSAANNVTLDSGECDKRN